MKRLWGLLGASAIILLLAGCLSLPQMLPAEYFEPRRTLSIEVADCPPAPSLNTDQPAGLIGSTTWRIRDQAMRNRMAGITTNDIHSAVAKALRKHLADLFEIVPDQAQLSLKVSIQEWGWYVPTGKHGESRDIHYFRLGGSTTIHDLASNRAGQKVYFAYNSTDTPLGDHLTKEKCEAALPQAADDFAAQIARFIRKGQQNSPQAPAGQ